MSAEFVHENGMNESSEVGSGTRIWAFAHVMNGATVGTNCNIGEGAFVESGARLGNFVTLKNGVSVWDGVTIADYAFLGPNAVLTNDPCPRSHPDFRGTPEDWLETHIGTGASIGANATIVCGNDVGPWALVGAGAVVTRDVAAHALVVGNPARQVGWVCHCARRLLQESESRFSCATCDVTYDLVGGVLRCPDRAAASSTP